MKYLHKEPFSVKMCPEGMTDEEWDSIFKPKKKVVKKNPKRKENDGPKIVNLGDSSLLSDAILDM